MSHDEYWTPKAALVTGGASGIGRALVAALSASGVETLLVDRDRIRVNDAVNALSGRGAPIHGLNVDLATTHAAPIVSDRVQEVFGRPAVDVVVSNAGILGPVGTELWNTDMSRVRTTIDTNLLSHISLAHQLLPKMIASGTRCRYIFTGSMAPFASGYNSVPYAATKAALVAVARGISAELRGTAVHSAVVCPGFVRTPMTAELIVPAGAGGESELAPEHVAEAVIAHLQTDDLYIFPSPDTGTRMLQYVQELMQATEPEQNLPETHWRAGQTDEYTRSEAQTQSSDEWPCSLQWTGTHPIEDGR